MQRLLHSVRDAGIRRAARYTRASNEAGGNSILVIQPDHLGDILLSQPAVRHIRSRYPDHHLVAVVGPWSESIARRAWPVDEVVAIDFPGFRREGRTGHPLSPYLYLKEAADRLRDLGAVESFVLRPDDWWSAWLASMVTTGNVVTAVDRRMDPFSTDQIDLSTYRHAATRALAIAGAQDQSNTWSESTRTCLSPDREAVTTAEALLARLAVPERFVVIHPGSGAAVKLWPTARWREIARRLVDRGLAIVVTGSQTEATIAREVADGTPGAVSIAGQTDLETLIAVLDTAQLVIGPDCGPLHLTVACQTPTVHLFGPSDPAKFGPWGPPNQHQVVTAGWTCDRCGDLSVSRPHGCGCMLAITVDVVEEHIQKMIDQHAAL